MPASDGARICPGRCRHLLVVCGLAVWMLCGVVANAAEHPLDPLSKEEFAATVAILKTAGKVTEGSRFHIITLHEPPKSEVLAFRAENAFRREAFAVVHERTTKETFEAVVDLNKKSLVSWKKVPGVQPSYTFEDNEIASEVSRADRGWQEAMRKRGITDFENVAAEAWPAGNYGLPDEEGRRLTRTVFFYRGSAVNYYARPIEGVVAYVDLDERKVGRFIDTGVVPMAKSTADLDPQSVGAQRPRAKQLQIAQPEGAGFQVRGNEVSWDNWRFRFGMNFREGLVLYTVGYQDGERLRPVLYRGSISEMVVPYADSGPTWFFRNVFDEGELGLGMWADSFEPGDAPSNSRYFDYAISDAKGQVMELPRAIALYERDGGILWKHFDLESKHNESRRARELVLGFITTVGNYEYGFNWVFHQDGVLEMQVDLSGIMEPQGVQATSVSGSHGGTHAHLVAPHVAAVHHQHFFNFRLDLDVDGSAGNSVVEVNTSAAPQGPKNPYGREFVMREKLLRTELEAQRTVNTGSSRLWKVIHSTERNALGQPVGYALVPGDNAVPYMALGAPVRKRAGFLNAHLWATPYDANELFAAGDYPNQSKGGDGLPKWTSANRSVEKSDVVLWYTMGITHIPRPEEWPVMNVHRTGFKLMPSSFFARNPALDVPPEASK